MKEFRRSVWIGFIWSIVFGTMLHFLYGWTGENRVVGLYAAVSESTWEHLKLLFFPVLLYTVWEYIWLGHRWKGYVQVRAESVLLGMLTARRGRGSSVFGAVVLAVIAVCFGVFSLFPPAVGIFAIP